MSLLDRISPSVRAESDPGDPAPYALAFGYGLVAPVALGVLLLIPVIAAWTLDPRTSTAWTDALAIAASGVGLSLRASVSVPHNGIDAVHAAPSLLTILLVVLVRYAYRPVQFAIDDAELDGSAAQRSAVAFGGGFVVSALAVCALSMIGPACVILWSVLPGAVVVVAAGVAWSVRRDGAGTPWPWAQLVADRLHLNVRRGVRPALEGLGLLLLAGTVVSFGLAMMQLERIGKVSALLDVSGSGTALMWLMQLLVAPNFIVFGSAWLTGAPIALGAGSLSTSSATAATLPAVPVFGALPEPGHMPMWAQLMVVVPVLIGGFLGWRAAAALPTLTHLARKIQLALLSTGLFVLAFAVLTWWSRMGMSPGRLDVVGPTAWSVLYAAVEVALGASATTAVLHWMRIRR